VNHLERDQEQPQSSESLRSSRPIFLLNRRPRSRCDLRRCWRGAGDLRGDYHAARNEFGNISPRVATGS
jgi:hypothetical protein